MPSRVTSAFEVEDVILRRPRPAKPAASEVPAQAEPPRRLRITRLMALAIKIQSSIDRREFRDYAEVASLGHVTRARMTQIMNLLNLAPDIQEAILFEAWRPLERGGSHERSVRDVCREVSWAEQRRLWAAHGRAMMLVPPQ